MMGQSVVFDARGGVRVVDEGGKVGVTCVPVKDGEDSEGEGGEDEKDEDD